MAERKTRADWIDAARTALGAQGVEAVRVEPLAAAMGVTKGSFYWHFADRDALLAATLEAWRSGAATEFAAGAPDPTGALRLWIEAFGSAELRSEVAVREWARRDPRAGAVLAEIDAARLAALGALFSEFGLAGDEAAARARFFYRALLGGFVLGEGPSWDAEAVVALLAGRATPEKKPAPRRRETAPEMPDLFG